MRLCTAVLEPQAILLHPLVFIPKLLYGLPAMKGFHFAVFSRRRTFSSNLPLAQHLQLQRLFFLLQTFLMQCAYLHREIVQDSAVSDLPSLTSQLDALSSVFVFLSARRFIRKVWLVFQSACYCR